MIIDEISNLKQYKHIHPAISSIIKFLSETNLENMADGRIELENINGFVNIQTIPAKNTDEAKWESHKKMIDLQIPLTSDEIMGYSPITKVKEGVYDEEKDLTFHDGEINNQVIVHKGMFTIFFPQDAHAPGIAAESLKKAVFKIPVNNE